MEPRVSNLLLAERIPDDRHNHDIYLPPTSSSTGAVFPSTALPAIRPLDEIPPIDTRSFHDDPESLTLPEIDWNAVALSLNQQPPAPPARGLANDQPALLPKKSGKSRAPIAEVLNKASPEVRNAHRTIDLPEPEVRKRRRLDDAGARTLPRPALAKQKSSKRLNMLPPLLVPLHEPPPNAGLIPSMTTEGIRTTSIEKPSSQEAAPTGKEHPAPTPPPPSPKPEAPVKSQPARRMRHSWSDEETSCLLQGVAKLGIGSWKKILAHSEYKFNEGRTAVDLKDRFRTICPDEYRNAGGKANKSDAPSANTTSSGKKKAPPHSHYNGRDYPPKFEHKLPDELARLGINGPFPKSQRRARRGFTAEEDAAILRGFEKYGSRWTEIQGDESLGLSSRRRTDIRDRFRNKYPEKFAEAGFKVKAKKPEPAKADGEQTQTTEPETTVPESSAPRQPTSSAPEPPSALAVQPHGLNLSSIEPHQSLHPLRLLTAPLTIPESSIFPDFGDLTPDGDDPEIVTLSRSIFDWADQNSRLMSTATGASSSNAPVAAAYEISTITSMDQFSINPMLALGVPSSQNAPTTHGREGPVNLFPQLPLSGILNGPVSLPSAAELVSGLEVEEHN